MAASRARRTPLALAVLSLLNERPMHPYEMQALIRDRHVGRVVRMRGGSVYDAVARLAAHDLIAPTGSSRAGARPERTTFTITAAGRAELDSLLDEYLAEPVNEYPRFAAGLAHILNLTPGRAAELLTRRAQVLRTDLAELDAALAAAHSTEIPPIVLVETELDRELRATELRWVEHTAKRIADGELPWAT
ncbi:PadR family transcriptional regulator [Nocardia brasiliensis]